MHVISQMYILDLNLYISELKWVSLEAINQEKSQGLGMDKDSKNKD